MNIQKRSLWRASRSAPDTGSERSDIVIVGNGIAGLTAAIEARRLAPEKQVTIVTRQCHPTIHTPALKQFAIGKLTQEQLLAQPSGTERLQSIRVVNASVESIQSKGKSIRLSDGHELGYASLLLATGSAPLGLPAEVAGRDFDGVLSLHRLGDYLDLRRRLRLHEVKEAVVIGGGTHAIETVMALLHWGVRVHWLIRGATFLSHMLDQTASDMVLERTRGAGASIRTSTRVAGIIGKVGSVAGVVTHDQQTLACQMVIVCTGTAPVITLAEQCDIPLKHTQGILVDSQLRTSAQHIYAAGDVAALQNPQTGVYQTRPQWQMAVSQGRLAAAVMTGQSELASPPGTPWHATHLGELALLAVGDPQRGFEGATTITDTTNGNYRRLTICGDRLISYLSVGATHPDSFAIKRIIDEERSVRNLEKVLLAGELDLRHSSALSHSSAAQKIVTTGELPAISISKITVDLSHELANRQNTEPLPRISASLAHDERITGDSEDHLATRPQTRKLLEQPSPVIGSVRALMSKRHKQVQWIIPGVLPQGLVALTGRRKVGKSWFDLSLGVNVANGRAGIGNMRIEQGNVLYLALEDNEQTLQERLSTIEAHGVALSDDFEFATTWPQMDTRGLTELESWLFRHPQARLIMIDSWEKVQPTELDGEVETVVENESMAALKSLADTYSICILVQFHALKSAASSPFDALKNMTSITEYADGLLHLKRAHGASKGSLSLYRAASAPATSMPFTFHDGLWSTTDNGALAQNLTMPRENVVEMPARSIQPFQEREEVPLLILNRIS